MKRFILAVLLLLYILPTQVFPAEIPVFNANGKKLPLNPSAYTENDMTMLPVRAVAEYLGAEVNWDPANTLTIKKEDCKIVLTVGQNSAIKEHGNQREAFTLDNPPIYKNGTLFVPLRFVAEALDTPVNYCVNYQDDTKYPAIFLGESKYAENYGFEDLLQDENKLLIEQMRRERANDGTYSWDEINLIVSLFIREAAGLYAESYNIPRSFGDAAPAINEYYAFYIADEVLASPEWRQYLALAQHQRQEMSIAPLQIAVTEDKITGTYGFELFAGFLFIPLLADVEITRYDYVPNPSTYDNNRQWTDDRGYIWRVTKIDSVRSYLNCQALQDNEPELYERWAQEHNIYLYDMKDEDRR